MSSLVLEPRADQVLACQFSAMASPCELLVAGADRSLAQELGGIAAAEALRVEYKFSRYRDDSVLAAIHAHRGTAVQLDEETASLLDFAQQCYELSEGLFDVTSGILRQAWRFDGSDRLPRAEDVERLLPFVGFDKLTWRKPWLTLPLGMELDFGGIGKEYAVDKAYELLAARCTEPFLVNFGGDLRVSRPLPRGAWKIGVERPDVEQQAALMLDVERGSLATSGDAHRFLLRDGVRYGHVLNPRSGWPVAGAPRSVTVAASSCTEAGLLATLALLRGPGARAFLEEQKVRYWLLP
jgi:FAD:protein FMN transferase